MDIDARPYLHEYLKSAASYIATSAALPSSLDAAVLLRSTEARISELSQLIGRLAEAVGVSEESMRRAFDGADGLGVYALWRTGEMLREYGVPWSSGLYAVASLPIFRGHALSVLRLALLRASTIFEASTCDAAGRDMWRLLWPPVAILITQDDVRHRVDADDLKGSGSSAYALSRWLAARARWRLCVRDELRVLGDPRIVRIIAEAWQEHRQQEVSAASRALGLRRSTTSSVRMYAEMIENLKPLLDAVECERRRAPAVERAASQDAIEDMIEFFEDILTS